MRPTGALLFWGIKLDSVFKSQCKISLLKKMLRDEIVQKEAGRFFTRKRFSIHGLIMVELSLACVHNIQRYYRRYVRFNVPNRYTQPVGLWYSKPGRANSVRWPIWWWYRTGTTCVSNMAAPSHCHLAQEYFTTALTGTGRCCKPFNDLGVIISCGCSRKNRPRWFSYGFQLISILVIYQSSNSPCRGCWAEMQPSPRRLDHLDLWMHGFGRIMLNLSDPEFYLRLRSSNQAVPEGLPVYGTRFVHGFSPITSRPRSLSYQPISHRESSKKNFAAAVSRNDFLRHAWNEPMREFMHAYTESGYFAVLSVRQIIPRISWCSSRAVQSSVWFLSFFLSSLAGYVIGNGQLLFGFSWCVFSDRCALQMTQIEP